MKKRYFAIFIIIIMVALLGCSGETRHHKTAMPEPESFNAHFGDMDTDGDDFVSWEEFKSYFPQATPDIYKALDLDENGKVDHDEWHEFKEAHGMKDHD